MNRDEWLEKARASMHPIDSYYTGGDPIHAIAGWLYAIACTLLAREEREAGQVRLMATWDNDLPEEVHTEAKQMVAAQMEADNASGERLTKAERDAILRYWLAYNHHLGDFVPEGKVDDMVRLARSNDAADARIAELEAAIKAHRQALADYDYSPNVDDMALYSVLDKR